MQITREEAKLIIERTRGKFFGVTFRKRGDGSITKMIARNGVTKHLTPNVGVSRMRAMRQQTKDANLIKVWSADRQGYRSIGLESIQQIRTAGQILDVV